MEVFWSKGYESASISDLLDHMQINRGSLYATFGDKRTLFLQSLQRYRQRLIDCSLDALRQNDDPLQRIRETMLSFADKAEKTDCWGCLLTNAAVELAAHDREMAKAAHTALEDIRMAFREAITNARAKQQFESGLSDDALSQFLLAQTQGLIVMAKAGFSREACRNAVHCAMGALQPAR